MTLKLVAYTGYHAAHNDNKNIEACQKLQSHTGRTASVYGFIAAVWLQGVLLVHEL